MKNSAARRLLVALLAVTMLVVACTNENATKTRRQESPLYVAIGASDAVGTGARNPDTDGWVPQLYAKMPAGIRLANLAIPGLKLHQALEQALPVAVDLQPTVVTVWLAVNDLASGVPLDDYRADLDTLLGALARDTHAKVYVANVPDLTALPAFRDQPAAALRPMIAQWNDAISASVSANGAILVDLYSGWSELRDRPDYVSRDGLHPSTAGHRRLAEIFWQVVSSG